MKIAWLALPLFVTSCAPADIATASCESVMLTVADRWLCTVRGPTVGRASSISFDTESRNRVAKVDVALRVRGGTLRVGYADLEGDKEAIITREAPFVLSFQTQMHRERRSFTLYFEPRGGIVEGLTGSVNYETP